jgi:hypothetical protein
MCKETPAIPIPVNRVVDPKRIIRKKGGSRRRRGTRGRWPPKKLNSKRAFSNWQNVRRQDIQIDEKKTNAGKWDKHFLTSTSRSRHKPSKFGSNRVSKKKWRQNSRKNPSSDRTQLTMGRCPWTDFYKSPNFNFKIKMTLSVNYT